MTNHVVDLVIDLETSIAVEVADGQADVVRPADGPPPEVIFATLDLVLPVEDHRTEAILKIVVPQNVVDLPGDGNNYSVLKRKRKNLQKKTKFLHSLPKPHQPTYVNFWSKML